MTTRREVLKSAPAMIAAAALPTAVLAATEEADAELIALGRRLAAVIPGHLVRRRAWKALEPEFDSDLQRSGIVAEDGRPLWKRHDEFFAFRAAHPFSTAIDDDGEYTSEFVDPITKAIRTTAAHTLAGLAIKAFASIVDNADFGFSEADLREFDFDDEARVRMEVDALRIAGRSDLLALVGLEVGTASDS